MGFAGLLIWPLVYLGILQGYWGLSHAFLQSNGFLFCYIAGFLLTALPRFTGTENPSIGSQLALAATVVIGAVALESQSDRIAHTAFVAGYLIFFVLVVARFLKRDRKPPETFSLIGIGVFAGFLGSVLNALAAYGVPIDGWALAGKRLPTEGMTLLLVLGVGGFLGPRLLGFEKLSLVNIGGLPQPAKQHLSLRMIYLVLGVVILLSIPLEYGLGLTWMHAIRVLAASAVIALSLEPWRLPRAKTTLAWCVWVAVQLTWMGLWLAVIFPAYRVDMLHVLFIGGFTLLILAVGMRVTLSHGGHGLEPERKNWPLRLGLILGMIAVLSRVGAPFSPASYSEHLALASIFLMIALAIWGWRILRLMFASK